MNTKLEFIALGISVKSSRAYVQYLARCNADLFKLCSLKFTKKQYKCCRLVSQIIVATKHTDIFNFVKYVASPNIVRVIKSRRMRWAGHVARMSEERGCIGSW